MKTYVPNVSTNNNLKNDFVIKAKTLIFSLKESKYPNDSQFIDSIAKLSNKVMVLDNTAGTGKENINLIYHDCLKKLDTISVDTKKLVLSDFYSTVSDLINLIDKWIETLNGNIEYNLISEKEENIDLDKKTVQFLDKISNLRKSFLSNFERNNHEIDHLISEKDELNKAIINETDTSKINFLYNSVVTTNKKIQTLNINKDFYFTCFNLTDLLITNFNELIRRSEFSKKSEFKAKIYAKLLKIGQVVDKPEEAVAILNSLNNDMKNMRDEVESLKKNVFQSNDNNDFNQEAMEYKAKLMKEMEEKQ